MSNELNVATVASKTIYVLLFAPTGQVWNVSNVGLATYSTASRTQYAITLTELGTASGLYYGDFPTAITTAGTYTYYAYIQSGGSPAESDTLVGTGEVDWTGLGDATAVSGSMTGSDFRDYILRCGFKRTDKDTEIYEAITDVIKDLRRRFHFDEAKSETTTTDTISTLGDFKVNVESDFGMIMGIVCEDGTDAWPLTQIPKSTFDSKYPEINVTNDKGLPQHFTIFNGQIYIGPIPNQTSYVYRISYSKRGGTVTSSTAAVPFTALYRDILKDGVLNRLYEGLQNVAMADRYFQLYENGIVKMEYRETVNSGSHIFTMRFND